MISLENFNLDVSISPQKNTIAVGGSLENFILDRNFQSRSKSRIFLIFGPSGLGPQKSKKLTSWEIMREVNLQLFGGVLGPDTIVTKAYTKRTKSFRIIDIQNCKCECADQILGEFREKQRGGDNSGEGQTYHKAPPQKRFWTPTHDTFPPPFLCSRPVISLRGNGHRPDESHFLSPSKLVLEGGTLWYVSPTPKSHDTFCPPPLCEFPMNCSSHARVGAAIHM